jgi:hypothetical protein
MYEQKNQCGTISKIQALSMAHLYMSGLTGKEAYTTELIS